MFFGIESIRRGAVTSEVEPMEEDSNARSDGCRCCNHRADCGGMRDERHTHACGEWACGEWACGKWACGEFEWACG